MAESIEPQAPAAPEAPMGPYVYDYAAAPFRQVVMPKTVPLPSFRTYTAEVAAAAAASARRPTTTTLSSDAAADAWNASAMRLPW